MSLEIQRYNFTPIPNVKAQVSMATVEIQAEKANLFQAKTAPASADIPRNEISET